MTGNGKGTFEERLDLQSQLSDLARVPDWIERLATQYSIPSNLQFSINLCLEEVLSTLFATAIAANETRVSP